MQNIEYFTQTFCFFFHKSAVFVAGVSVWLRSSPLCDLTGHGSGCRLGGFFMR